MKEVQELQAIYGKEFIKEAGLNYLSKVHPAAVKAWAEEIRTRREAGVFDTKLQELLHLAACVVARNRPGLKAHTLGALQAGATEAEIIEVLLISAMHGSHPVLSNSLRVVKRYFKMKELEDREIMRELEETKAMFGNVSEERAYLARIHPPAAKAWAEESRARREAGVFDMKVGELIRIVGAAVGRAEDGLNIHIFRALGAGASEEEIMEVLLIAATVGKHSLLGESLDGVKSFIRKK